MDGKGKYILTEFQVKLIEEEEEVHFMEKAVPFG